MRWEAADTSRGLRRAKTKLCLITTNDEIEEFRRSFDGSSLFDVGDIKDVHSLITNLQNDSNQSTKLVSQFIWAEIDPSAKQLLADPNLTSSQKQPALVQTFNKILQGNSIYESTRFTGVSLRPETQSLITQSPAGEPLIRLNRLLLEDAYPLEITRNRFDFDPVLEAKRKPSEKAIQYPKYITDEIKKAKTHKQNLTKIMEELSLTPKDDTPFMWPPTLININARTRSELASYSALAIVTLTFLIKVWCA